MFKVSTKDIEKEYAPMKKLTTEEFITKAIAVHGSQYDYSEVQYVDAKTKVKIRCLVHGVFEQRASKHTSDKCGCPKCGIQKVVAASLASHKSHLIKKTTEEFVEEATVKHEGKYSYEKVDYKGVDIKVTITCKEHGDFTQTAYSHLQGVGCRKCADAKQSEARANNNSLWSYSGWEAAGKMSSNFGGFSLYVIECSSKSTGERFIKVGKTFVGVGKRFCADSRMPYKFKLLLQVYHNAYAISKLEEQIKNKLKEYKYIPSREFDGMQECLTIEAKDKALELADA